MFLLNNSQKIHGRNPFSLTYGGEAVIPAKVNLCSARVLGFAFTENDELMVKQLDSLEELPRISNHKASRISAETCSVVQ